ncbi:hypothetical protein Tco_0695626 [Tanacetum coccineum]
MDGMEFNRDPIPFARIITTLVEFIKNEHLEDDFRVIEVDDSPLDHPKDKSGLDASAKLTRTKLNKHFGDADLSKDKSGSESPPEFQRSWYVEGHVRSGVISSVLAQRHLRTIRHRYNPRKGPQSLLGDEGLSSRGNKLNSIFITAEVTFTKPKQPT